MAKHKMFPHPTERRHPHFRQEGGSKYPHSTWDSAVESAERMSGLKGMRFEPYACPTCDNFHIGRGLCDSHALFEQEQWRIELGSRVTAHLIIENHKPTPEKRINALKKRFQSAVRRRDYPDFWHGHRHGRTGKKGW